MSGLPLVSICIPTYNGEAFLQEALDSVMAQTYTNLEIIVSDDASTDRSWEMVERFRESVPFPIYQFAHKPRGIGANWNNTIRKAHGKYIKFLFQDDVLEPACVEKMVDFLEANPDFGLVACKRNFIIQEPRVQEIDKFVSKYQNLQSQFENDEEYLAINKNLFKRNDFMMPPHNKIGEPPTVMFPKDIVKDVGFFDENLKQILDYVFYYRLLKKYPIAILYEPLVRFRIHVDQATNINRNLDIPDYKEYDKILYNEFKYLLHPKNRLRLNKKYNLTYKILITFKRTFESVLGLKLFAKR